MDLGTIIDLGKELGYTGPDLQQFVSATQKLEREKEKEKLEREKEKEKFEREKEKGRIEREERAEERMAKKAQLEFEMVRLELETKEKIEMERLRLGQGSSNTENLHRSESRGVPKLPKMPPFDDQRDNIDAYLQRFERIAEAQLWPVEQWATYLSTLLKGKALEVYSRIDRVNVNNYDVLKTALLTRYEMTEEGFRQRFRNARSETGETFSQFNVRIENYLTRWIELSGTTKDYDSVKDLLVREQMLNSVGKELNIFLKERKPKTAQEMARLAEQFIEARGTNSDRSSKPFQSQLGRNHDRDKGANRVEGRKEESKEGNQRNPPRFMPVSQRRCYNCGELGHIAPRCTKAKANSKIASASVCMENTVHEVTSDPEEGEDIALILDEAIAGYEVNSGETPNTMVGMCGTMPVCIGEVEGQSVQVLRDTGCSGVIVRKSLVHEDRLTSETQTCVMADSRVVTIPVAWITIKTPFYSGTVRAACMDTPLVDLILGNIPGVRSPDDPCSTLVDSSSDNVVTTQDMSSDETVTESSEVVHDGQIAAVETRRQKLVKTQGMKAMKVLQPVGIELSRTEFGEKQGQDKSLDSIRKMIEQGKVRKTAAGTSSYFSESGLLYRKYVSNKADGSNPITQAVVPKELRSEVLKVCHESLMGGHMGVRKTADRVMSQFYWPGIQGDVRRHCMSCDICQKTTPRGKVGKIPLGVMPLIATPFERVAVDLIGPLFPVTDRGNRYILTVVDYATRYPEAVALPRIETEYVAEALLEIFSRVGVPKEMLSDLGPQFTSAIMKEMCRLLSLKHLTTTPYHAMCNGLVERFNGTLKAMLKRLSAERPQDWDRYLPALLFAYREVPQESLGFAPFDLLYGRKVRGPVQVLRELWTKDVPDDEVRTTYQYVLDLQSRLEDTISVAQQELKKASMRYKKYFNVKTKDRKMNPGDKVLILLPTNLNKLLLQWKGPYVIEEKFGIGNYRVRVGDKLKTYHANLLKKYVDRESTVEYDVVCDVIASLPSHVEIGMVDVVDVGDEVEQAEVLEINSPPLIAKETYLDVDISPDLTVDQQNEVRELMFEFRDVLTDLPGRTDGIEYKIRLTDSDPIRSKPYPLPHHMRKIVAAEVQSMLKLGVIEPSESPYASPIVLVKKGDNSYRFCCDFRRTNQVTVFDSEPMVLAEAMFTKLSRCQYFTKVDLSKAYWQIPMEEESKLITAFITPDGLYQWRVMPFGVVNAPAVFTRLMRKVLNNVEHVDNYLDDILEGTEGWVQHMVSLREVFTRLRKFHLTARPSKVVIGYQTLQFLGHTIGEGKITPDPTKLEKILSLSRPTTKKQVRALLGLTSYYRKFIPNFSAIASPLSDLTKKGRANMVQWEASQEQAFQALKRSLAQYPILRLPDLSKQFSVRTDASDTGIGAVLLQEHGEDKFPVMYVSRKLLDREKAYSVIEKECLAIVWGVQKLSRFLYGCQFVLETDHQPLVWMSKAKLSNGRVMRWALALQPYKFQLLGVKGSDNLGADLLSRCPPEVDPKFSKLTS
jgi:hypothetical protein